MSIEDFVSFFEEWKGFNKKIAQPDKFHEIGSDRRKINDVRNITILYEKNETNFLQSISKHFLQDDKIFLGHCF